MPSDWQGERLDAGSHFCRDLADRYLCGTAARSVALRCGFTLQASSEIAISVAELASNAVRHGAGGVITLFVLRGHLPAERANGIEVRCVDRGPGFSDVASALTDGWSRGRNLLPEDIKREGLGTGLGAVRRFMDELEIESTPAGSIVIARRYVVRVQSAR